MRTREATIKLDNMWYEYDAALLHVVGRWLAGGRNELSTASELRLRIEEFIRADALGDESNGE